MNNSNNDHYDESANADEEFAELVSSMPDLAALDPDGSLSSIELVEIAVPHPGGAGQSLAVTFEVPAEVAPALRAELSPQRVAATSRAVTALVALMDTYSSGHDAPNAMEDGEDSGG